MPRQKFTHPFAEVFVDLQHGINALVHRADPEIGGSPAGSTVVLGTGDELETVDAYPHPHLEHVSDEVSEAAATLSKVDKSDRDKSDLDAQSAAALKGERSAEGSVIVTAAQSGQHDPGLPGADLIAEGKVGAVDVAADPQAIAAVSPRTPRTPAAKTPAAPVVEAPAAS